MFCGSCGTERNSETARFCRACGATFHTSVSQPASLVQPMPGQVDGPGEVAANRAVGVGGLPGERRGGAADPETSAVDPSPVEPSVERSPASRKIERPSDDWVSDQPAPIQPPSPDLWQASWEQTPTDLANMPAPTQARLPFLLAALGLLLAGGLVGYVTVIWLLPL
jgi:hypothetical protein